MAPKVIACSGTVRIANPCTPVFDMQGGITWDTTRISEGLLFVKDIDTSIDQPRNATAGRNTPKGTYNLNGQRLSDRANVHTLKGIYIRDGKKIVGGRKN